MFRYCAKIMAPSMYRQGWLAIALGFGLGSSGCSGSEDTTCEGRQCESAASGISASGVTIAATGNSETQATSSDSDTQATSSSSGMGSESDPTTTSSSSSDTGIRFDVGDPPLLPDMADDKGPIIPETCEQALAGESTVGCTFFAVDMDSHDNVENQQYAVAVANVQIAQQATVTIEVKEGNMWTPVAGPQAIAALDLYTFNLPARSTDDSQLMVGGAYRVTSDIPVIAYQFNPVDGASSYLSDASMLFPVPSLDTINDVIGWTSMMDNTNVFQHGYATIIGTSDGTVVTVTPKVATAAGDGVPAGSPGVPFQLTLGEGDVASVAVQNLGTSMTGTKIVSNEGHPVAVLSGQECALIPENVCCCDHMEEQLAGLRQWGTNFVAARMPVRDVNNPETSLWQIYASEDGTQLTFTFDPGVTGIPNPNLVLNQGEMAELYVSGPTGEPGDFEVEASKPINVINYMIGSENLGGGSVGDPAMVQHSPVEQYLPRYVVLVPGTWVNDVAVVTRPAGAVITVDDVAISDAEFNPVGDSGFEVARVAIPDGVHVLDGGMDPFGVVIVGYDTWDSYAYLGGTGTGKINPNPPG